LLDSTIVRADPHALGLARYGPTPLGRYDAAQRACVANGWAPSSRGPHRKQPTWPGAVPSAARCPDTVEDGANAVSGRLERDALTDRLDKGRLVLEQRVGGVPRHCPKPALATAKPPRYTTHIPPLCEDTRRAPHPRPPLPRLRRPDPS
jgi:hypothetical protein